MVDGCVSHHAAHLELQPTQQVLVHRHGERDGLGQRGLYPLLECLLQQRRERDRRRHLHVDETRRLLHEPNISREYLRKRALAALVHQDAQEIAHELVPAFRQFEQNQLLLSVGDLLGHQKLTQFRGRLHRADESTQVTTHSLHAALFLRRFVKRRCVHSRDLAYVAQSSLVPSSR